MNFALGISIKLLFLTNKIFSLSYIHTFSIQGEIDNPFIEKTDSRIIVILVLVFPDGFQNSQTTSSLFNQVGFFAFSLKNPTILIPVGSKAARIRNPLAFYKIFKENLHQITVYAASFNHRIDKNAPNPTFIMENKFRSNQKDNLESEDVRNFLSVLKEESEYNIDAVELIISFYIPILELNLQKGDRSYYYHIDSASLNLADSIEYSEIPTFKFTLRKSQYSGCAPFYFEEDSLIGSQPNPTGNTQMWDIIEGKIDPTYNQEKTKVLGSLLEELFKKYKIQKEEGPYIGQEWIQNFILVDLRKSTETEDYKKDFQKIKEIIRTKVNPSMSPKESIEVSGSDDGDTERVKFLTFPDFNKEQRYLGVDSELMEYYRFEYVPKPLVIPEKIKKTLPEKTADDSSNAKNIETGKDNVETNEKQRTRGKYHTRNILIVVGIILAFFCIFLLSLGGYLIYRKKVAAALNQRRRRNE